MRNRAQIAKFDKPHSLSRISLYSYWNPYRSKRPIIADGAIFLLSRGVTVSSDRSVNVGVTHAHSMNVPAVSSGRPEWREFAYQSKLIRRTESISIFPENPKLGDFLVGSPGA